MTKRLPLTVIGGFLGSGKTSLLNHWLRNANGQRLAVLVNDFGSLNIDADLIQSNAGDTIELTNGCVCCQISDDLSLALIKILDSAELFSAVVVEASGVSDPWRIAQIGRADPGLLLDGVVVTVNADSFLAQMAAPMLTDTLVRQLKAASLVVLNHCDLTTRDTVQQVREKIARIVDTTPMFEARHAEVPLPMLTGLSLPAHDALPAQAAAADCTCEAEDHPHSHTHTHTHTQGNDHAHGHADPELGAGLSHGDIFETWSSRPTRIFSLADLKDRMKTPPSGLLRLKGFVPTGLPDQPVWYEIQFAGKYGSLRVTPSASLKAGVVAIGLSGQLPRKLLADFFT
jgi:G3E family GTPase